MATSPVSRVELLQTILNSTRSYPKRQTKSTSGSVSNSLPPPVIPHSSLSSPEDITSTLIEQGLSFKLARSVSQAYLDKAVQLQLHSQASLASNHRHVAHSRPSSRLSSHKGLLQLQTKLRKAHEKVYRRDLSTILSKTIQLAKVRLQAAQASQRPEDSEDDRDAKNGEEEDEEEVAGEDGSVNADDEKALQDMSAVCQHFFVLHQSRNISSIPLQRSSVLLSRMYERGFTFPRRYEKIKLAEETGLTYRQIGIWVSPSRLQAPSSTIP